MNDKDTLDDWFGANSYRELDLGEAILDTDKYLVCDSLYSASDIGNGRYSVDHWPHYRGTA